MLTKELADQVDEYLAVVYSPTPEDMKYFEAADEMILEYTFDGVHTEYDNRRIWQMADELLMCMQNIFQDSCGVTPRLLQYQERYYQLLTLYAKANDLEGFYMDALALLCFTSSFDLYYLKNLKYKEGSDTNK